MSAPISLSLHPLQVPLRAVVEWELTSSSVYDGPFADIAVDALFTAPSGVELRMPAFYDGNGTWRVRFNPGEVGAWSYRTTSVPHGPDLEQGGQFGVTPCETRGFLHATPGEGWGFEFPFYSGQIFTAEWEELWMRYLIARYDAFTSTWFWTPLNEYEYYPNGDWHYTPVVDRWQRRISRWIKANAPHGQIVSAHNGPGITPFAERFAANSGAVDAIMFLERGISDET